MGASFTLEAIKDFPTRSILRDGECVGYLYRPAFRGDAWEIWPSYQQQHPYLDTGTSLFVSFASEADALAFLGIRPEMGLAA